MVVKDSKWQESEYFYGFMIRKWLPAVMLMFSFRIVVMLPYSIDYTSFVLAFFADLSVYDIISVSQYTYEEWKKLRLVLRREIRDGVKKCVIPASDSLSHLSTVPINLSDAANWVYHTYDSEREPGPGYIGELRLTWTDFIFITSGVDPWSRQKDWHQEAKTNRRKIVHFYRRCDLPRATSSC